MRLFFVRLYYLFLQVHDNLPTVKPRQVSSTSSEVQNTSSSACYRSANNDVDSCPNCGTSMSSQQLSTTVSAEAHSVCQSSSSSTAPEASHSAVDRMPSHSSTTPVPSALCTNFPSNEPMNAVGFSSSTEMSSKGQGHTFGLLGNEIDVEFLSEDEADFYGISFTSISVLPVEILENIFCRLPIIDMYVMSGVCKHWYHVITKATVNICYKHKT